MQTEIKPLTWTRQKKARKGCRMKKNRVENMRSERGNDIPNQFIIQKAVSA